MLCSCPVNLRQHWYISARYSRCSSENGHKPLPTLLAPVHRRHSMRLKRFLCSGPSSICYRLEAKRLRLLLQLGRGLVPTSQSRGLLWRFDWHRNFLKVVGLRVSNRTFTVKVLQYWHLFVRQISFKLHLLFPRGVVRLLFLPVSRMWDLKSNPSYEKLNPLPLSHLAD